MNGILHWKKLMLSITSCNWSDIGIPTSQIPTILKSGGKKWFICKLKETNFSNGIDTKQLGHGDIEQRVPDVQKCVEDKYLLIKNSSDN